MKYSIRARWKVLSLAYVTLEDFGRDPDRSWCYRHTVSMTKLL